MELDYPKEDGTTHRDYLEHLEERGIPQPGLDVVVPSGLDYLWDIFWELNSSRGNSGYGPAPISFLEIEAWSRVKHHELNSWEMSIIRQMDVAFLDQASKMQKLYYPVKHKVK